MPDLPPHRRADADPVVGGFLPQLGRHRVDRFWSLLSFLFSVNFYFRTFPCLSSKNDRGGPAASCYIFATPISHWNLFNGTLCSMATRTFSNWFADQKLLRDLLIFCWARRNRFLGVLCHRLCCEAQQPALPARTSATRHFVDIEIALTRIYIYYL